MRKQISKIIVSLMMLLGCVSYVADVSNVSAVTTGTCGEDCLWTLDNGVLTLEGSGQMYYYSDNGATHFKEIRDQVREVIIDDRITHLSGFGSMPNLTTITFPESFQGEEGIAFQGTTNIKTVKISDANTTMKVVDNVVFSSDMKTLIWYPTGLSKTNYTVPEGVETIGSAAFQRAENLKKLVLPSTLKTIKNTAFYGCKNLLSLEIPVGVETIEYYAFSSLPKLKKLIIPYTVTEFNPWKIDYCTELEYVIMPSWLEGEYTEKEWRNIFYRGFWDKDAEGKLIAHSKENLPKVLLFMDVDSKGNEVKEEPETPVEEPTVEPETPTEETPKEEAKADISSYSKMDMNVYPGSRVTKLQATATDFSVEGYMFETNADCIYNDARNWREIVFVNTEDYSTTKAYRNQVTAVYNTWLNKNMTATNNGTYKLNYANYKVEVNPKNINLYAGNVAGHSMNSGSYYVYMRISNGKTSYLYPLRDATLSDGSNMESKGTLPSGFTVSDDGNRTLIYTVK